MLIGMIFQLSLAWSNPIVKKSYPWILSQLQPPSILMYIISPWNPIVKSLKSHDLPRPSFCSVPQTWRAAPDFEDGSRAWGRARARQPSAAWRIFKYGKHSQNKLCIIYFCSVYIYIYAYISIVISNICIYQLYNYFVLAIYMLSICTYIYNYICIFSLW